MNRVKSEANVAITEDDQETARFFTRLEKDNGGKAMITTDAVDAMTVAQDRSVRDEEIVSKVLAGEVEMFETLMRRYNQRLFRVSRSIVNTDHDAEDVLQETYLQAYSHLADFEGRSQFSTWLTKIAIHAALTQRRRLQRFSSASSFDDEDGNYENRLASSARGPEDVASNGELGKFLEGAVDALPGQYRSVFMLRQIEGMDTADTAEHLGISEEAVKTRLHRARLLLRRRLKERLGEAIPHAFHFLGLRCSRMVDTVLRRLRHCTMPT